MLYVVHVYAYIYMHKYITGINFNKYEDIPVEASGEGCPKNIDKFSSCDFSEIIQGNIDVRVRVCTLA